MFTPSFSLNKLSSFWRDFLLLSGGSTASQVILVCISPILARLYTPDEYGYYTFFTATLSMLLPVACAGYQQAIPIPKRTKTGRLLFVLSTAIAIAVSLATLVGSLLIGDHLAGWFLGQNNSWLLFFIAPSLFLSAMALSLENWHVRINKFRPVASAGVAQSCVHASTQTTLGLLGIVGTGLIVGDFLGRLSRALLLAKSYLSSKWDACDCITLSDLVQTAREYWRFPLFSAPSALLTSLGTFLFPLIIGAMYGSETLGWLGMAIRVGGLPVVIIGQAMSQLFVGRGSSLVQEGGEFHSFFILNGFRQSLIGICMFGWLLIAAPSLFEYVFGEEWITSGCYLQLLTPFYIFQFIALPLSQTLILFEAQKIHLAWNAARLLSVGLFLIALKYFDMGIDWAILGYSAIMSAFYLALIIISFTISKKNSTSRK